MLYRPCYVVYLLSSNFSVLSEYTSVKRISIHSFHQIWQKNATGTVSKSWSILSLTIVSICLSSSVSSVILLSVQQIQLGFSWEESSVSSSLALDDSASLNVSGIVSADVSTVSDITVFSCLRSFCLLCTFFWNIFCAWYSRFLQVVPPFLLMTTFSVSKTTGAAAYNSSAYYNLHL